MKRTKTDKYRNAYWKCECDCGNKKEIMGRNLIRGLSKSCWHCNEINLVGKKFGKISVINYIGVRSGHRYFMCKCDCGKQIESRGSHLVDGSIKSCGCSQIDDISGKKFGFLRPIEISHTYGGNTYWKCKCKCGKLHIVMASNLKKGDVKSCGCSSSELFRKSCIAKYGVTNPAQSCKIMKKIGRANAHYYIKRHWKTNKAIVCQASYEKLVVEYLNKNKINFRWHPSAFKVIVNNVVRYYYPDLYLPNKRKWIEIKGYKREIGMKKWNYFHKYIKQNSELWDKGILKNMGIL